MLETKNLVKIYKPKKGVPVKALDGVSLKFPDKGMVFLLGKSGSGKSTLLNLLGGLDKYNDGEIIIKGVSSKKFRQSHFDSYRNTYVGFIFQEYNILEEFTVGANIALALELQGRKATDEEINRILHDVDLDGYGNRRPNELSGGQKQRVAIARALVKNPKIIMADEPSGALDSATGKQVFDTLKKLSRDKLVIVVSHDRDFASDYADRIIELADGKVISDTTLVGVEEGETEGIIFEGATAKVPSGYRLTEEDRIAINEYLEKLENGIEIEVVKKAKTGKFAPTRNEFISVGDKSPFKLIKSKLALKHAFKIGASGLKYKKIRLVFTILLSCVAFILFGLVDTFSAYNHIKTCTNSLNDSNVKFATVSKYEHIKVGEGIDSYTYEEEKLMTDEDLKELESETGVKFNGVYRNYYQGLSFENNISKNDLENFYMYDLTARNFNGAVEIDQETLGNMGYSIIAGELPDGNENEIAISTHVCETFIKKGYVDEKDEYKISKSRDMIGRTLDINGTKYKITAVIDTLLDYDRYESLYESAENKDTTEQIVDFVLYSEFSAEVQNSYARMMMLGEGGLDRLMSESGKVFYQGEWETYFKFPDGMNYHTRAITTLGNIDKKNIIWLDGERETLGENEMLVSLCNAGGSFGIYYETAITPDGREEVNIIPEYNNFDQEYTLNLQTYYPDDQTLRIDGFKIVGVINDIYEYSEIDAVVSDDVLKILQDTTNGDDGDYALAIGAMPETRSGIEKLVTYCYSDKGDIGHRLENAVCYELDAIDVLIETLADIFIWVGLFFAVFASILLSNFIATSISYKKQEIGILRAIGSRGNDVFRIFFAESFIIAMINFVLSCLGTGLITFYINLVMRENVGLLVTVLRFGPRQILILFVISVAVAAIASFLPVKKIASKRPIDAIRNR